jgi:hypothetical protein
MPQAMLPAMEAAVIPSDANKPAFLRIHRF